MTETWGHCPSCDRWFYIEDPTLESLRRCPVCLAPADRLDSEPAARTG